MLVYFGTSRPFALTSFLPLHPKSTFLRLAGVYARLQSILMLWPGHMYNSIELEKLYGIPTFK